MKLYTEEQVRTAIKDAYLAGIERPIDFAIVDISIMKFLTPIELPTDEEIRNSLERSLNNYNVNDAAKEVWIDGAKWMREQILKQNLNK